MSSPRQVVFTSHKVQVNAKASTIWDMLIDKIRRPDKYVPGVVKVEVLKEHGPLSIDRRMETAAGQVIEEIIVAEPMTKTVIFKQKGQLSGMVTNTIYEEGDLVFVEYVMTWSEKTLPSGEQTEEEKKKAQEIKNNMEQAIKGAVLKAKEHAEEVEQGKKE